MPAQNANTPALQGSRWKRLRRALVSGFPNKRSILGIFLPMLALAGRNVAEPLVLKYIFDSLSPAKRSVMAEGIPNLIAIGAAREMATARANWQTWRMPLAVSRCQWHDPPGRARYFVCEALANRPVALEQIRGESLVRFRNMYLRQIDLQTGRTMAFIHSVTGPL